jgi:hypothetical protein
VEARDWEEELESSEYMEVLLDITDSKVLSPERLTVEEM